MTHHNGASLGVSQDECWFSHKLRATLLDVKYIMGMPRLLSVLFLLFFSVVALAQTDQGPDQLPQSFTQMNKDASLGCALFLPGNVPGITEMMTLCGGRYAFKVAPQGMLESQLLMGAGKAQKYYLGSFSYRYDFQVNDIIASFYGGLDIHDAVSPVVDAFGNAYDSNATWYIGVHVGGALWWEITDTFFLRTDLQLNVNPGTSLLVILTGVLRFDAGGGGG